MYFFLIDSSTKVEGLSGWLGLGATQLCCTVAVVLLEGGAHAAELPTVAAELPKMESEALTPPPCEGLHLDIPAPQKSAPIVLPESFGAKGDGITDDTAAINAAIKSMVAGGTLLFTPGKTYLKRKNIVVDRPNVKLWGYGAILRTVTTADEVAAGKGVPQLSILMRAPRTGVYGLTIVSNLRTQLIGHQNNGAVFLASEGQEVVDGRFEYTGNGIVASQARKFLIARNVVYRTWSDGIHVTTRSEQGVILCNLVRETGDDMIAVVAYGKGQKPNVGGILIEGNDVAGQFWGRGIAVAGGRDITIRRNRVSRTHHGAGIIVVTDTHYRTANVYNVLVEENEISDVQTEDPAYNPKKFVKRTKQGAIDVHGQGDQRVEGVTIRGNILHSAAYNGVAVRGNACAVLLEGNRVEASGWEPVRIATAGRADCLCASSGNTFKGKPLDIPDCKAFVVPVSGAQRVGKVQ